MGEKKVAPTMSVREMRELLGIGKTESYWLIKKGFFETTVVKRKMRVYIDSFEKWYDTQVRYRKANGPAPLASNGDVMTLKDMCDELGIKQSTAYYVVMERKLIAAFNRNGLICMERRDFEDWYRQQFRFNKVVGEPPGQAYPQSMTPREMSELLGIPLHNTAYELTQRGLFKTFTVDRQLRIDLASFEQWYRGQEKYRKVEKTGVR